MKNISFILFSCICFLAIQSVKAQNYDDGGHNGFKKGDQFISGLVGYNSISQPDKSKERTFKVSPRYGYFLNDFIAVGGRLGYTYNIEKNRAGEATSKNISYAVEGFGRYYLLPGSQFSVFGELAVGFGQNRNIIGDWTNGINAGFSPGLSYFLGQHFALEATFGVISYNTVNPRGVSGTTDNFQVGIDLENINFGIIYKF